MPEYKPLEHLLSKHNILFDFKITYQVNSDEIDALRNELSKKYKTKKTIDTKINQYVQGKFEEISTLKIPGCIYPETRKKKSHNKPTIPPKTPEPAKLNTSENLFIQDFKSFPKNEQRDIVECSKYIIDHLKSKKLSYNNLFFIFQLVYNSLNIKSSTFSKISKKYENHSTSLTESNTDDSDDIDNRDDDGDLGHLF